MTNIKNAQFVFVPRSLVLLFFRGLQTKFTEPVARNSQISRFTTNSKFMIITLPYFIKINSSFDKCNM